MFKKSIFSVLVLLGMIWVSPALSQKLVVKQFSGIENSELLGSIQKLTFSNNELNVDYYTGPDDVYILTEVQKLYFDLTVSVDENALKGRKGFSVYPNPAREEITVMGIPESGAELCIYRMDGSRVYRKARAVVVETVDVSHLPAGLYLLNVSGSTLKFVKR
jgi:hypothetical protein